MADLLMAVVLAIFLSWSIPTMQVVDGQFVPLPPQDILGYQVYRRPFWADPVDLTRVGFVTGTTYDDETGGIGYCWRVQTVTVDLRHSAFTSEVCVDSCH